MERHGEEVDVTTTEGRAGYTPHVVRWVLGIALALVIIGMAVIFLFGATGNERENRQVEGVPPSGAQVEQLEQGQAQADEPIVDETDITSGAAADGFGEREGD